MTQDQRARPSPGETPAARPATRVLVRPPGERYAVLSAAPPGSPNVRHAVVAALAAGAGTVAVFGFLSGVADLVVALPVVAAAGGWLIGAAVRHGAWPHGDGAPSRRLVVVAVALALGTWLVGEFGAYLFSLLLRPGSALSFTDRLAGTSFLDWLTPQFGPLEIIELFLFGGLAWYASR